MQIVQDYRYLHTVPEPDRQLSKTAAYIRQSLDRLRCRVFSPVEGSVCAYFDFRKPHTLAFRADMDALPIPENTGLPWQSRHPGFMHACGHDGHCAILLELARRVSHEDNLTHNVLLIFQPAEETTGGAEALCRTGLLEQYRVKHIFALHLWPGLEKETVFSKAGCLMSRGCGVSVTFSGKSVHIANWRQGQDALAACCRFYALAETLNSRDTLLKFGSVRGGTAPNVICDRASLHGSLRTAEDPTPAQDALYRLCQTAANQTGCTGTLRLLPGYPAVENPAFLLDAVQRIYPVALLPNAFFTTEDFSHYQHRVPGLYCLLGLGDTPPLHSDRFCFDETVLTKGADFFYRIATALADA